MDGMKRSMKISLIIIAPALLACLGLLFVLRSRPDDSGAESILDTSRGPAFEVRVGVPRMGRPLGGILPDWLVKKRDGIPSEFRFDHTSRGAQIGTVGQ